MKDYLILFALSVLMLAAGGGVAMMIYSVVTWLGRKRRGRRPGADDSDDDGSDPGFGFFSGPEERSSDQHSPIRINGEEAGQPRGRPVRRHLILAV